ncbi:hypothetical protein VIGAN_09057000, partial [Vigna angularis var. angularis]
MLTTMMPSSSHTAASPPPPPSTWPPPTTMTTTISTTPAFPSPQPSPPLPRVETAFLPRWMLLKITAYGWRPPSQLTSAESVCSTAWVWTTTKNSRKPRPWNSVNQFQSPPTPFPPKNQHFRLLALIPLPLHLSCQRRRLLIQRRRFLRQRQ